MTVRLLFACAFFLWAPLCALAAEKITDFDVEIEVQRDGDILVTETISVIAEGGQIRRGVFRDLPRYYLKEAKKLPYRYDVRSVTRNGEKEPYAIEEDANAFRIRIGDADRYLAYGPHAYAIVYEVKNQVRYFDNYDELYWNATGTYWAFPIERARVRVKLPGGAGALQEAGYTGSRGSTSRDYLYQYDGGVHRFEAAKPLRTGEGLTIALGFEKGVVDPPSAADARAEWWTVNASRIILVLGIFGVGAFYLRMWARVGRDPAKGPVFPQYEPPEGYSPAATHYVFHRGMSGHSALIATLIHLAIRKFITIENVKKKKTSLTQLPLAEPLNSADTEMRLLQDLLGGSESVEFGGSTSAAFTLAYTQFQERLRKQYGASHFRWNRGFLVFAMILSALTVGLAVKFSIDWTAYHTGAVVVLVMMALAGGYFLPAPTEIGQKIRTEIEGFRLYLKTAEQLQLNAVEVGSEAPPPMSIERYERFLPYAIALGVEKPWTEHFEKLMPREAAEYRPAWSNAYGGDGRSLHGLNSALVSGIASGVASALPQSSSSSGAGGGGSSGGGGGGGGGGGW